MHPAGTGPAGEHGMEGTCSHGTLRGKVLLEQMWELNQGHKGIKVNPNGVVSLTAARSEFLPPKQWKRILLPYKALVTGGSTIVPGLQKPGLVAGLTFGQGGQMSTSIYNSLDEVVHLTPKTVLVNIHGADVSVQEFGRKVRELVPRGRKLQTSVAAKTSAVTGSQLCNEFVAQNVCPGAENRNERVSVDQSSEVTSEMIEKEVKRRFPKVGDFSTHPVNDKMAKLVVRKDEVCWMEPTESGVRTQYSVERVADRRKIVEQLEAYVKRGYIRKASSGERLYLSPLLPLKKPDGRIRFTTDFRKLNQYFSHVGTSQVDVWRKLWEIDESWRYFMEIDLKDGFFGIPVDESLSRLFGFTFGSDRYVWLRLPQGWMWSSVLFGERVHEILTGIPGVPQYSDNVLVGAKTPEELMDKALQVFERFDKYGLKVNFGKVKWMTTKIKFLGYEIEHGKMCLREYFKQKMEQIGCVRNVNDLERIIGVISYARHVVQATEDILVHLRNDMKTLKKNFLDTAQLKEIDGHVEEAFRRVHSNIKDLTVLGLHPKKFILETDWSEGHIGYMLFAELSDGRKCLVDIGSKSGVHGSSYLGELKGIVWACKQTKAYRGDIPLTIQSDNHGIHDKERARILIDDDCRSFRRWGWLLSNEPGFELFFLPGVDNTGADLLSRKGKKIRALGGKALLMDETVMWVPGQGENFVKAISQSKLNLEKVGENAGECGEIAGFQSCQASVQKQQMRDLIWEEHRIAHLGSWKVYKALRRKGHKVSLRQVRKELQTCEVCAQFLEDRPRDEWHSLLYSTEPGGVVYVDVIGPLPTGRGGVKYIQCIVDSATRLSNATKHKNTEALTLLKGMDEWLRRNGKVGVMVTDNAAYYASQDVERWCKENGVEHRTIAPYRHQSVGLVERYNRKLENALRKITLAEGKSWSDHLTRAVTALNEAVHETTGFTPVDLWHGEPSMRQEAKRRSDKRRQSNSKRVKRRWPINLKPGKQIMVRDYETYKTNKFAPFWRGPFRLTEQISATMWRAEPVKSREGGRGRKPVHVFHQDQIRPMY